MRAAALLALLLTMHAQAEQKLSNQVETLCQNYRNNHAITGLVVAVIAREKEEPFEYTSTWGTKSKKSTIPVNLYTEFRLGALTQLFTANVLAYFVQSGQVSLNDPISKFLSKSMVVPTYHEQEITLGDLATHTSGLPNMPYSLSSRSNFRVSQMYRFLSLYDLKRAPGSKYEYSHLGYAFLSNLLSRIGKRSFPELVEQIILTPLNLRDTTFTLSHEQKSRYAIGYDHGQGVSPLNREKVYSVFIGSGGLYSTIQNMLTYLSFNLGQEQTSLNALLPIMEHPYYKGKNFDSGLAWQISPLKNRKEKLFHLQGNLFGFSSYMGIIPEVGAGVVLLSNWGEGRLEALAEEIFELFLKETKSM